MIAFEPIPVGQILLSLPMPIAVGIGIYKMVQANNQKADTGNEILDALRESVQGLREANLALAKVLQEK
ncbi:MAG: hypothetical protein OXE44_00740 [Nitrospinae bacterium]|nr:hypothetical protein [Nitrospinota bacterium]